MRASRSPERTRIEPRTITLSDCFLTTFNGEYEYRGEANGKPHWSSVASGTQHLYWAPDNKCQWLLRNRFTPGEPICSAYSTQEHLRRGSIDWNWVDKDKWVPQPLKMDQEPEPATDEPGAAELAAADKQRQERLRKLREADDAAQTVDPLGEVIKPSRFGCDFGEGSTVQLGPFLGGGLPGLADGQPLVRRPPPPFRTFERLSNCAVTVTVGRAAGQAAEGDGPDATAQVCFEISVSNSVESSDESGKGGPCVTLHKTALQVHHLREALVGSGEEGADRLPALSGEPAGMTGNTEHQQELEQLLQTTLRAHADTVEVHAFMGWGPKGKKEPGDLASLRQRRRELTRLLRIAKEKQTAAQSHVLRELEASGHQTIWRSIGNRIRHRTHMQQLKMRALRKIALAVGLSDEQLETYYDLEEPKHEIAEAVLENFNTPQHMSHLFVKDRERPKVLLVSGHGKAFGNGVFVQGGVRQSFPYYNNGDRIVLSYVTEDGPHLPLNAWKMQREPGGKACVAYLRWKGRGVPLGLHPWTCFVDGAWCGRTASLLLLCPQLTLVRSRQGSAGSAY